MNVAVVVVATAVRKVFLDVVHDCRDVVGGTRHRNGPLLSVVIAFAEPQSVDGRHQLLLLLLLLLLLMLLLLLLGLLLRLWLLLLRLDFAAV